MKSTHVRAHSRSHLSHFKGGVFGRDDLIQSQKKIADMKNKDELIRTVEEDGFEKESYPVDESQTNSNTGDAVLYEYEGHLYEITTWRPESEKHSGGEKTITMIS